jgi:hypothetical protein
VTRARIEVAASEGAYVSDDLPVDGGRGSRAAGFRVVVRGANSDIGTLVRARHIRDKPPGEGNRNSRVDALISNPATAVLACAQGREENARVYIGKEGASR